MLQNIFIQINKIIRMGLFHNFWIIENYQISRKSIKYFVFICRCFAVYSNFFLYIFAIEGGGGFQGSIFSEEVYLFLRKEEEEEDLFLQCYLIAVQKKSKWCNCFHLVFSVTVLSVPLSLWLNQGGQLKIGKWLLK